MQVPLELSFDDVSRTPDIEALVARKVEHMERICDHITACRVAIEKPHEHASSGNPYRVRIEASVPPRHRVVVTQNPQDNDFGDPLDTVIRNAFAAAERQLREIVDRQQGEVKARQEERALVVRLFDDEGYGFLETPEGREIFFHRAAVADDAFDRLAVGTEVRFEEVMGEEGPQASTVQIVSKLGEPPSEGEEEAGEEKEADAAEPPVGWES